jgi:hypothetical protein
MRTAGRPAVRAHGASVHVAGTRLPSYRTGAAQAGGASTQASRLAPRRHSFALGRLSEAQSSAVSVASAAMARLGVAIRLFGQLDHAGGRGWGLAARHWATVQADRGANRRFGAGPPDRGSAPASVGCPGHVLCLVRSPSNSVEVRPCVDRWAQLAPLRPGWPAVRVSSRRQTIARVRARGTMNRPGWSNTSTALRVTGKVLTGRRVLGERCLQISLGDQGPA